MFSVGCGNRDCAARPVIYRAGPWGYARPNDPPSREAARADAIAAWNRRTGPALLSGGGDDTARLDYIERTFSGMTDRERYLPVVMVWGKGANGRTLREACDKYMKRDAAMQSPTGEPT